MEAALLSLSEGAWPFFVDHIMNTAPTSYRPIIGGNLGQYVSFETLSIGTTQVLEVYDDWQDVKKRFGLNFDDILTGTTVKNTPNVMFAMPKFDAVMIKYVTNQEEIVEFTMSSMENDGESQAEDIRREYDMQNANFGYKTSRNGKFADNGGLPGVDFYVFTSMRKATGKDGSSNKTGTVNNMLPGQVHLLEKHVINAMVVGKSAKGLCVPNQKRGDMWIRLSKLVYRRMTDVCYPFSLEDLEVDPATLKYKLKKTRQMDVEEDEEEL